VVVRDGAAVWTGATSTSTVHRRFEDLVPTCGGSSASRRAVLSTGSGLVPATAFTLCPGDLVTIEIEEVGQLRTPVAAGRSLRDVVEMLPVPAGRPVDDDATCPVVAR
jgi:fumarylacetoacetate (FAA) hydrolase family protein